MEKLFIAIYRFFEKKKALMYGLLILSSVIFIYFGSKVQYEENIAKLLPQTDAATESGLAFGNLRVKDKIFIQLTSATDQPVAPETLAAYCDEFIETIQQKDTATHYIANVLYQIDDDLIINGLDYALTHVPSFVLPQAYARFDSLLTEEAVDAQMALNYDLVMNDEEGNKTTMVGQDPAALRMAMIPQGMSMDKGAAGFTLIDRHLFVPDSTVALAFLAPNFSSFDSMSGILLVDLLEEEIKHFTAEHPEVDIYFHGNPVNSVFNSRQIRSDLWLTVGLSLLVICMVLGYCFRNKSTLFMLLSPVVYGVFFSLACMYWLKGGMSLMAMGIGAIVMGVALSYCLHVLTHYKYVSDPVQILKDQATPVILGCLTTIGAFLGLLFTESDLLKDFGWFASFAMVGTTFFALVFLPHFFRPEGNRRSDKAFRVLDKINSYPLDEKRGVRIALELICLVCLFTAGWVTFDSNLRNIGYNEPKVVKSRQLYEEKNSKGFATQYYAATAEDLDEALVYNKAILATLDSLKQEGALHQYAKVSELFIPLEEQEERIALWKDYWTEERIADVRLTIDRMAKKNGLDPVMFEPFYMMIESDYEAESLYEAEVLPESLVSNFIEETTEGNFMVFTSVQLLEENKKVVNDAVAAQPHAVVIDPFYYTNDMVKLLNDDFNTILGISSVFVFLVLLVSFRSIPIALIAFLPMGLSWYVVQGIMGIFGVQFNLINIIIATFIFGIGVDYSIFVMTGLIAKAKGEDDNLLTYHKTAIFFSAFVLMVVTVALLFATHPAIHSIGISTLIGMSATILITYTLQPALFRYLMKFRFFAKGFKKG
jgi:predicted RND superfamily exporter protein